ncbi:hypothetical protein Pint_33834 [Pistacia integerrima]|uniref:Uncharacterized protein n=1 Tax=Pistacia integerrima TaxID=434235 RepID=A0ACC0X7H2_9ROSI|nr:hypothetical protein Pint_33834 [Pistacia integerrima]
MKAISKLKCIRTSLSRFYTSTPNDSSSKALNPSALIDDFTRFCYQRDLPRAIKAMDAMQIHCLHADSITYSELIKCCLARGAVREGKLVHNHVFSKRYEPKTFLINILINMYVKFNLLEDAKTLFDKMPERTVVSWTTMIWAYCNAKMNDKVFKFFILMLRKGVRPNMYTYSSILRSCVIKVGLDSDVFVRSALIDVYAKRDLVVWNSIIGGLAQNSDGDEALNLFKRMKRVGFVADQATLTSVLRAHTRLALLELGTQVHVHVLKYDQDLILNNALLDMYCKCGSLEDAKSVFDRMVERDVISWSTMIQGLEPNYITILGVLFSCSHAGLV